MFGEDAKSDLAFFGIDPAKFENHDERIIEVEPEDEQPVRLFMACVTQWRYAGVPLGLGGAMLIRTGMDYAALPVASAALGIAISADTLAGIRILEDETLVVDRDNRKRAQAQNG